MTHRPQAGAPLGHPGPAEDAGAALLGTALPTLADPPLPNDIPPHRHFIVTPDGRRIEVGPRVCDDPSLQQAFNQFHINLHRPAPGSQGPQAPGLHNGVGAELRGTRAGDCSPINP